MEGDGWPLKVMGALGLYSRKRRLVDLRAVEGLRQPFGGAICRGPTGLG